MKSIEKDSGADEVPGQGPEFVQVVRAALSGRPHDVQLVVRRLAKQFRDVDPTLANELVALLRDNPGTTSPMRRNADVAIPLDQDSRLRLLRVEASVELEHEPVYDVLVQEPLDRLVEERKAVKKLRAKGLYPTRTALFTGLPGVGKTLAARWLARSLELPLLTLDLSAVMSSFLGRTGNNVRAVLDYAKANEAVLLIDELDAVAKRRDDDSELGELKRLVTVLLQEIDEWPPSGLLIAATNHPELLDRAVWRRFEMKIDFPVPDPIVMMGVVSTLLSDDLPNEQWASVLATAFAGLSPSDVENELLRVRRDAAMDRASISDGLIDIIRHRAQALDMDKRMCVAMDLVSDLGVSQRETQALTGISRDTLRKRLRERAQGASAGGR